MATSISYFINNTIVFSELNGTQEELDYYNSGYKYHVEFLKSNGDTNFICQGNDNDIMQGTPSSSSDSSGSEGK